MGDSPSSLSPAIWGSKKNSTIWSGIAFVRAIRKIISESRISLRALKLLDYRNPNFSEDGRDGKIRTCDPLYPKQVRYQAALRPD